MAQADELAGRMRRMELFHALRLPGENWTVLRLDGRGFSRFTGKHFDKPFDLRFHQAMVATTRALTEEFVALYGYTQSDEISLLLPPDWALFDREVEKLLSLSAGLASAAFTREVGELAVFDARCWCAARPASVLDYFGWRQDDGARCALNAWCYWTLRKQGKTAREATRELHAARRQAKHELLFSAGINYNDLPLWQRRGSGLLHQQVERAGVDPRDGRATRTSRRVLTVCSELPAREEYRSWLQEHLPLGGN